MTDTLTIGDFLVAHPYAAPALETLGIDFCCGGQRPLGAALQEKGLDPATFVTALQAAAPALSGQTPQSRPIPRDTAGLIDHIVSTHHRYLRDELPRLCQTATKVAQAHGVRKPSLMVMELAVHHLAQELLTHLDEEEQKLFPRMKAGDLAPSDLIADLVTDHEAAGDLLASLRQGADNYTVPDWACTTYRSLMTGLEALEKDLHQHIHLENNILFRRKP